MARGGDKWDGECCAVHDGSIADFKTLNRSLSDITKIRLITKRSDKNMLKVGKIAGGVGAVALVATGVGAAVPAINCISRFFSHYQILTTYRQSNEQFFKRSKNS